MAAITPPVWAGGSGLNVVVIVNKNSTDSVQLANAYCELRGVPPQNVLWLTNTWSGGNISCTLSEFQNDLLAPLMSMISSRSLTNQIEFVLLSMDLPYKIFGPDGLNSTTSALFYGFKANGQDSCSLPVISSNSYAFSELAFPLVRQQLASTSSFLAVMLTDSDLDVAKTILKRGVASDSTFPIQLVYLSKTSDSARNVRYIEFDNAIFDARIEDDYSMVYVNSDFTGYANVLGLQTGLATLALPANGFIPGAMGDSLTSYAGRLFENSGQTSLLAFLEAGAAGSYGTVDEPCNYLEKFPNPLNYFYQSRGFSLAESYYQSIEAPYQGLIVGEPLSAPFAHRGLAVWDQLPTNSPVVLAGQTNLELQFNSVATNLPLGQVDLFIDGVWFETVTNLQPSTGDQISLTLNGVPISYTVPDNASIAAVAIGLAGAINSASNTTLVAASLAGERIQEVERDDGGYAPIYTSTSPSSDRIELHSLDPATSAAGVALAVSPVTNTAVSTTFINPARADFVDSIAAGYRYFFLANAPLVGDWLQLTVIKTNGDTVIVSVTNSVAGTTAGQLVSALQDEIAGNGQLQLPDGIYSVPANGYDDPPAADFFTLARSSGWPAAQIQVALTASSNLTVMPAGTSFLQDNLSDLQPRNFLYVSSGALSIPIQYSLETSRIADGFHELSFVAYEGNSVRTQTRISRNVRVQNGTLEGSFNTVYGGTNTDVNATLWFSINANTNNIATIELFGSGGSLGIVNNQSNALLSVSGPELGLGLHPFYAIITDNNGNQYRTQTIWIRLTDCEPPFSLSVSSSPTTISWPATAGRSYDVLMTTNLEFPFQTIDTLRPSNSIAIWCDMNIPSIQSFYRIRTSN